MTYLPYLLMAPFVLLLTFTAMENEDIRNALFSFAIVIAFIIGLLLLLK